MNELDAPRVDLIQTAAASAWHGLRIGRTPTDIQVVSPRGRKHPRKHRGKSIVYRLVAGGPEGESVIAKRSRALSIAVESHIYREVLGPLDLGLPRCYGHLPDADGALAWLFLEEVRGVKFREDDDEHRQLASAWLGQMHAATGALWHPARQPVSTANGYRESIDVASARVRRCQRRADLEDENRQLLSSMERTLGRLTARWATVAQLWQLAPRSLVHRDFIDKNVLVDHARQPRQIRVLDWEVSAWGVPAEDLAGVDIETYHAHAEPLWAGYGQSRLQLLAKVGTALRAASFLKAYAKGLESVWFEDRDEVAEHCACLANIEDQLGW